MITLVHGENSYLARVELEKLTKSISTQTIFADEAKTLSDLIFSTDNLSLFESEQKLTILKNLSKNRKKSLFNELAEYIEKNHENIQMVLFETSKFDARTKLYKTIKKLGNVVETKMSSEPQLLGWIASELKQHKVKVENSVAKQILARVGTDQNLLENELGKLTLLVNSEKREKVEQGDLEILTESKDAVIWDFMDAMTSRDKKRALHILERIYKNDSDFPYLCAMLSKQIKMLYWLKSGSVPEEVMKKDFGVHPYTISLLRKNLSKFETPFLKLLFSKLTNLDFKVKQGKIEPKLGLILLISSV